MKSNASFHSGKSQNQVVEKDSEGDAADSDEFITCMPKSEKIIDPSASNISVLEDEEAEGKVSSRLVLSRLSVSDGGSKFLEDEGTFDDRYPVLNWADLESFEREESFPDGKRVRYKSDGRSWTLYKNGTIRLSFGSSSDSSVNASNSSCSSLSLSAYPTIIYFTNGDVKVLEREKHVYFYAGTKTIHTSFIVNNVNNSQGSTIQKYEFMNGQIEVVLPNGERHVKFPDGTRKTVYPDTSV